MIPISPAERAANRRHRILIGSGLGLCVLASATMLIGPASRLGDARGEHDELSATLDGLRDSLDESTRAEERYRDTLDRAGQRLVALVPFEKAIDDWRFALEDQAAQYRLALATLMPSDPIEIAAPAVEEDDVEEEAEETAMDIQEFRFDVKGRGSLRSVLAFVQDLERMEPITRPVHFKLIRDEAALELVGFELTVSMAYQKDAS